MPEKSSNPSAAAVEDAMKHEEGANILYTNSVCLDHFKELPCHTFVDIAACPDPRCLWADSVIGDGNCMPTDYSPKLVLRREDAVKPCSTHAIPDCLSALGCAFDYFDQVCRDPMCHDVETSQDDCELNGCVYEPNFKACRARKGPLLRLQNTAGLRPPRALQVCDLRHCGRHVHRQREGRAVLGSRRSRRV